MQALFPVALVVILCTAWTCVRAAAQDVPAATNTVPAHATGTHAPAADSVWATGVEYVEIQAHIVKITDAAVYVDAGGEQGVTPGASMTYFESVDITDMQGNALGTDLVAAGVLRVDHVDERLCSAAIVTQTKEPQRGMLVKFLAAREPDTAQGKTLCPEDMQLVPGGSFAYVPGALTRDSFVDSTPQTGDTDNFCVDIEPDKQMMSWREARDACGALGKRLCAREEQRKTCARNTRKPACSAEQANAGVCPRGSAVEDFTSALEWSAAWAETDPATDAPASRTGSSSCTGQRPASSTCYYPECNGISKKYRCCADPQ